MKELSNNKQLDLRTNYADTRRKKIFKNTLRVIWKTKSKYLA